MLDLWYHQGPSVSSLQGISCFDDSDAIASGSLEEKVSRSGGKLYNSS